MLSGVLAAFSSPPLVLGRLAYPWSEVDWVFALSLSPRMRRLACIGQVDGTKSQVR